MPGTEVTGKTIFLPPCCLELLENTMKNVEIHGDVGKNKLGLWNPTYLGLIACSALCFEVSQRIEPSLASFISFTLLSVCV